MHPLEVKRQSNQIFSPAEVDIAIKKIAQQITTDLEHSNPIILCIVVGGIYVTGQILPHLSFPLRLNYIHATRYNGGTLGYQLTWKAKPSIDLKDQNILLIDDILDEGITLKEIKSFCLQQGAKSVSSAVLIDKTPCRHVDGLASADYVGLQTGSHYLFGCGLDYNNYLRNEPGIYAIPNHILDIIQKKSEIEETV